MYGKCGKLHHGYGIPRPKEVREKVSANHQDCAGAKNANAKTYKFIDPKGNEYIVVGGFKQFCKNNNLAISTMCKVLRYKINPVTGNCKNWKVFKI